MSAPRTLRNFLWAVITERNLLILLVAISVGLNLLFAYTLAQTRSQMDLIIENRKLTIGEIPPKLTARRSDRNLTSIDLTGQNAPTVLYLYSTSCHWCVQNELNLRRMSEQAMGRYRLIALSLDKDTSNDDLTGLDADTLRLFDPTTETKLSFDLRSTPTTILFSEAGEVQKIWKGAYTVERKKEIESVLGIELPGLPEGAL